MDDLPEYLPYIAVFILCSLTVLVLEIFLVRMRARSQRERAVNRRMRKAEERKSPEAILLELRKERGLDEFGNLRYFSRRLNRLYVQSGYTARPIYLFLPGLLVAVLPCLAIAYLAGTVIAPAVVGGMLFLLMPLLILLRKRAVRQKQFSAQLPDALDVIVRSLRAGCRFPFNSANPTSTISVCCRRT